MNLSSIEKSFTQIAENIDYSWKKPSTYLVMVPALAIAIQKIQLAKVLPLIEDFQKQPREADEKSRKFVKICAWHWAGALTQLGVCLLVIKTVHPFFLYYFLGLLAVAQLGYTLMSSLSNRVTLIEFHANGTIKSFDRPMTLSPSAFIASL